MDMYWDDEDAAAKRHRSFLSQRQQQRSDRSGQWAGRRGSSSGDSIHRSSLSSNGSPTRFDGAASPAGKQRREQTWQQERQQDEEEAESPQRLAAPRWGARGRLQQKQGGGDSGRWEGVSSQSNYHSGVGRLGAATSRRIAAGGESDGTTDVYPQQRTAAAEADEDGGEEGDEEAGVGEEVEKQLLSLRQVLQQLEDAVAGLPSGRGAATRQTAFLQHQRKIQRLHLQANMSLAAVDLDLRSVATSLSYQRRTGLLQQRQQLQRQLTATMRKYEELLLQQNVKELTAMHAAAADEAAVENSSGPGDSGLLASKRETLVRLGDDIQDKTQASLHRTRQLVAETEEVGGVVLGKMQQQTEQLQRAGHEVEEVQTNVARAKKTAITLARNAAGDRFTQCLCLFIFLFLVIAVVLVCAPRRR